MNRPPSPLQHLRILALAAAALCLAACSAIDTARVVDSPASRPASTSDLLGRWQALKPANQDAFVEFAEHGLWFASDGCNRTDGHWKVSEDGNFETGGGGAMTQVGCNNVDIPWSVHSATSAILEADGSVVFSDDAGSEMTLVHTSTDAVSLVGRWAGPASSTAVTLIDFKADGTWASTFGCSQYIGTWKIESGLLSIGPEPASDQPICLDEAESTEDFPFSYDTDFQVGLVDANMFSVRQSPLLDPGTPTITFVRAAESSQ
ncbi:MULTISPECIES: hypothetical protein [unclassified Leucobacter]|uniref:hypothetical protein n=1 Tax=unclassified Leucobacter TaxID=2621730 RepID=UPI00165DFC13|nr:MULTISPECIES: hypothetical protein [unclassified Leucobacter]MBC9927544.1 hypothetical protein [Leucobacter sp. cx-169]